MPTVATLVSLKDPPGGAKTGRSVNSTMRISLLGERQTVDGKEWVRIAIEDGSEPKATGWIRANMVVDADPVPDLVEEIDRPVFVENCLIASYNTGANVHFLAAWAEFETGIRNVAKTVGAETRIGPFQFTQKVWDENRTSQQHKMDFLPGDIGNPAFQCEVAALAARRAVDAFMGAADNASPTVVQLVLALRVGVRATVAVAKADPNALVSDAVRQSVDEDPDAEAKAAAIIGQLADLLTPDSPGQPISVGTMLARLHERLDAALTSTRQLILAFDEELLPRSDGTIEDAGQESDGEEPESPDTTEIGAGGTPSDPIQTKVPFAVHSGAVASFFWPVITTSRNALVVSHRTTAGRLVGWEGRRFLANRQGGRRFHVGVDVFCSNGEEVVACADGTIAAFHRFYMTKAGELSFALLVDHGDFVINYGEVKPDSQARYKWRIGDRVSAGQKIARVSTTNMIHFETYKSGTVATAKWMQNQANPPSALRDPTKFLIELSVSGKRLVPGGFAIQPVIAGDLGGAGAGSLIPVLSRALFEKLVPPPSSSTARKIYDGYVNYFTSPAGAALLKRFRLDETPNRLAHFFAQAAHETGGFRLLRESLHYTTVGAVRSAWPKRAEDVTDSFIEQNLLKQPIALGDWAYGGRMGNKKGTNDGYDYRGGGTFQTTGRNAYREKGSLAGVNLESNPDLIEDPAVSTLAACAEWDSFNGNALADAGAIRKISRAINIGNPNSTSQANGEGKRIELFERLSALMNG